MLTFQTAKDVGIPDVKHAALRHGEAWTLTGSRFRYYEHPMMVRIQCPAGPNLEFSLRATFAENAEHNVFGLDWLPHMRVAFDAAGVHLYRL